MGITTLIKRLYWDNCAGDHFIVYLHHYFERFIYEFMACIIWNRDLVRREGGLVVFHSEMKAMSMYMPSLSHIQWRCHDVSVTHIFEYCNKDTETMHKIYTFIDFKKMGTILYNILYNKEWFLWVDHWLEAACRIEWVMNSLTFCVEKVGKSKFGRGF